ncbi:growth factor receptor-bound protein 2-like isoform X2 [Lytechinus variegatus]|uniref:growth factor receptor-bound protein 2-like isoform X2 n=1 Tax=Lytechinus variegatus TaxID=7654 RepID=UPI001BB295C4|nr:growth factor receptor-bound protein 2-like isoform X2 [Lytechinus variegatus]
MEYVAQFDFTPSKDDQDELGFKKGDVLKVTKREDRHWLFAHIGPKRGLVPENYLKPEEHKWYNGGLTRKMAEEKLMDLEDGAFLVRDSESTPGKGNFSLSVKFQNAVQHFKILTDQSGKYFLWVVKFLSVNELVNYHKKHSVSRSQTIVLQEPYDIEKDEQLLQQREPANQFQQREYEKCKALYNFDSQDPSELSFQQNEIITLIARQHDDWWKGEIRTAAGVRSGIFPKNYVKVLDPHMH